MSSPRPPAEGDRHEEAEPEVWISYAEWQRKLQDRVIRETTSPIPSPEKVSNFQLQFFVQLDELPACDDKHEFIDSAVRLGIPNDAAAAFFRLRNDQVTRTWIDDHALRQRGFT